MCRLIIATKKAVEDYNKKHNLLTLLEHLEKECGGHGNGIALFKKGICITLVKSVKTTIKDVYDIIMRGKDYDTLVFHTRIASCGEIDDERCHPFMYGGTGGSNALAMNGTIYDLTEFANAMRLTDTEVVCRLLDKTKDIKEAERIMKTAGAVFVGIHEGKPYAVKNNGALEEYVVKSNNDFFFASSFPKGIGTRLEYGFTFIDGKRCSKPAAERIENTTTYTFSSSKYKSKLSSWYDRYVESYYDDGWAALKDGVSSEDILGSGEEYTESEEEEEEAFERGYKNGYSVGYENGFYEGLDEAREEVKILMQY